MRTPDVTVIVPVLNEATVIRETAATMLEQRFDGELELLFVDGGSSDGTRELLDELARRHEHVKVLDNPGRRQALALNIGLREARGQVVARMDAHTFYPPDYVAAGVRRLRQGGVACVGGPQLAIGDRPWSRRIAAAMRSPLGVGGAVFRRRLSEEVETDTAFTGIWPRQMLAELGGWDEAATVNEDGELAARILAAGGRIVCIPEMAAECMTRDSLRGLATQYYRYGKDRSRTLNLHPHVIRRSHVLAPALVLTTAIAALRRGAPARLAALGLRVYAAALAIEAARLVAQVGRRDAAHAPLVFATMHFSWGAGFLAGCAAYGVPVKALARLAGKDGSARLTPRSGAASGSPARP